MRKSDQPTKTEAEILAVLFNMNPRELKTILAPGLAHIRRFDYAVNFRSKSHRVFIFLSLGGMTDCREHPTRKRMRA